jgi:hypothetical protein
MRGDKGATREQLENFIAEVTQPVGESMIPRRVSTVLSWLDRIGMVQETNGRFSLKGMPANINIVKYQNADEPLFPKKYDLAEYQSVEARARESKGYINVLIVTPLGSVRRIRTECSQTSWPQRCGKPEQYLRAINLWIFLLLCLRDFIYSK